MNVLESMKRLLLLLLVLFVALFANRDRTSRSRSEQVGI